MADKLGIVVGIVCWLTLVIAGGNANKWSFTRASEALPFHDAGRVNQAVFLTLAISSYTLFLVWIQTKFYSNASLAFALFVPVFLAIGYSLVHPNLLVALLFGAATGLYFGLAALCTKTDHATDTHLSGVALSFISRIPSDYTDPLLSET
jgi:hypothetical protein